MLYRDSSIESAHGTLFISKWNRSEIDIQDLQEVKVLQKTPGEPLNIWCQCWNCVMLTKNGHNFQTE